MAKAIPSVRCNIIFAKCIRQPSIVLSLSLSLIELVSGARDRRTILAELISARKKKNASKYADTLDDLPNEGAVVFVIYRFLDRRTCRACGSSSARFPLQVSSLMDPLPRSFSRRHVDSDERVSRHAYTNATFPENASATRLLFLATALCHSCHYSHRLCFASPPRPRCFRDLQSRPSRLSVPAVAMGVELRLDGYLGLPRPNLICRDGTGEILRYRGEMLFVATDRVSFND